jgi:hypothetical protein
MTRPLLLPTESLSEGGPLANELTLDGIRAEIKSGSGLSLLVWSSRCFALVPALL